MYIEEEELKPVPVGEESSPPIIPPPPGEDMIWSMIQTLQNQIIQLEKEVEELRNEINTKKL